MTWLAWRQQQASLGALGGVVGAYLVMALAERASNGGASRLTSSLAPYLWLFAALFLGAPSSAGNGTKARSTSPGSSQ